jgi:hypothetical protein
MVSEELKQHLRQDHGVHEGPIEIALTEDESSYLPGLGTEDLESLHLQHHSDHSELLSHTHSDSAPE